jgi:hypothetical protein
MNDFSSPLRKFERRVRTVRAWVGAGRGLLLGAALASAWAVLDGLGWWYTEWAWLGALSGAGLILGALIGFLRRVPAEALAASIDRRADLDDRLATALEHRSGATPFDAPQRTDALGALAKVRPNSVYPVRLGRLQAGAVALTAVAASIFLLGNTPLLLNPQQKQAAEASKRAAKVVERIRKDAFENPKDGTPLSDRERKLAAELQRMQRDLEKARLSPEEMLKRRRDLEEQARELMKEAAQSALKDLDRAETALDALKRQELEKNGFPNVDPKLAAMSEAERREASARLSQQQAELRSQLSELGNRQESLAKEINELERKLNDPNLSKAEREALEKELAELRKQQQELAKQAEQAKKELQSTNEQMEALKLSERARKTLQKMMESKEWQELQQLAQKMRESAQEASKGEQPKLSREERLRLQEQLEELLKQLEDEEAMKEYLEALKQAMQNSGET